MAAMLHLTPTGPAPCRATTRPCPYEATGHYATPQQAEKAFGEAMGGSFGGEPSPALEPQKPTTVRLTLPFGELEVEAGTLASPATRFALANGLCGDLALALHARTGGTPHFVVIPGTPPETLAAAAEAGTLGEHVAHALIESREHPGMFIDSYGLKTREEVENFYSMELRAVPLEQLQRYGSGPGGEAGAHDVTGFAQAAEELASRGESYSYYDFPEE